jgi:hypothetical protein
MKFSILRNEINNDRNIPPNEVESKIQNDAVQEIQERYLKNIYGGTFTSWQNAFG